MPAFVHLRVKLPTSTGGSVRRTFWAIPVVPGRTYRVVNNEGEDTSWERPDGVVVERRHFLLISPDDIVWERAAHMSRKYAWLVEGDDPDAA